MKYKLKNKNYFILLFIFVICNNILKSQTFLPPQQMFDVNGIEKYLSSNDSIFKFENKMKFGFHWGGEKKISDALGINFIEINSKLNENFLRHQRASNTDAYLTNSYLRDISEAMSMEWKANLLIDTNKLDELQTRAYDSTRPVFGFSKIKGKITNTTSSNNRYGDYNYLNLDTCNVGDTVLQGNSHTNKFTTNLEFLDSSYNNWNGKNWYLSVNLKKDATYN